MTDRTPKLSTIRAGWVKGHPFPLTTGPDERSAEFERAIAEHDAEIRADQIEKDAEIADDAPGSDATGYYAGEHVSGYNEAVNHIAATIRAQLAPRPHYELFPDMNVQGRLDALTIIRKDTP